MSRLPNSLRWLAVALLTAGVILLVAWKLGARFTSLHVKPVTAGVFVSEQIQARDLSETLSPAGIQTIIDFRPDGESALQLASAAVERLAHERRMGFYYIPVPHGEIPDSAVLALLHVLSTAPRPVLLYCRTGRRAIRTFALAEAMRTDGPSAEAIAQMVKDAGFSAEDLQEDIGTRITVRKISERRLMFEK